ncbi:pyridoxamine 5'-phosphate oxidase [Mycolicibacillus parakoreensis]|uniref:Pyridoxine/pyridoxamine 5'-phosphate oxidase n=1 Tax=Mycolicibacillus parakoreensis TaxID=1069221 RepID=A0ABY3U093_9MYCO|nr:pyridoxamine 5'-phosphate oxidase [Mycolicibacillus parakoreensis]MCV7315288.1 pyridoxamine 5'-phosphate oxidase [Mycolicibacillus parakoreensis]ULN53384.1 pyridoxamine 5'-phosphate oxidase [Mycolicibacillus parakoreensis]
MSTERDASADLDADWLAGGWVTLLRDWLAEAHAAGLAEPDAMVLATVAAGRPVTRSVLCRGIDEAGITFFTHYDSAKGAQLAAVPHASVTFPWYALGRQVHVRGAVHVVDREASEAYWAKRPRGSQLGAWASRQSQPIADRAALLAQFDAVAARFADTDRIPLPPGWGGYQVSADEVEFWQGRENRVHNRIRMIGDRVERLQP